MSDQRFEQYRINEAAKQILPPETYTSQEWFLREQKELFARSWFFVGTETQLTNSGDYNTANAGKYSLFIIRDNENELRAFHNTCRHRGTELVDIGCGNIGKTIVCPYHRWSFGLDGALRGIPDQKDCFPEIDKKTLGLHPASVGVYAGLVFANPEPHQDINSWIGSIKNVPWPHDLTSSDLQEFEQTATYELQCNWKVFFENAVDGYHLAYLHEHTLGGPTQNNNIWDDHGDHLVWYSTEDKSIRSRTPEFVTRHQNKWGEKPIPHAAEIGYGGVYVLFPTTLIVANPWSFSISYLEPVEADVTLLHVRAWAAKSWLSFRGSIKDIPGYDGETGLIKSSHWKKHPLETGDFQTEDVYVVEKMQRALHNPKFCVSALAQGAGGEAAIHHFQQTVSRYVPPSG